MSIEHWFFSKTFYKPSDAKPRIEKIQMVIILELDQKPFLLAD